MPFGAGRRSDVLAEQEIDPVHVGDHLKNVIVGRAGKRRPADFGADLDGPINNLSVPSLVSRGYAPAGRALVSVTVVGLHGQDDHALEETVRERAEQLASIPASQLSAMKLVVNHAFENMGISSTQVLGPILDGLMRNTPDALTFVDRARDEGVRAVIEARDGRFADYSQAPADQQPDPSHVIHP